MFLSSSPWKQWRRLFLQRYLPACHPLPRIPPPAADFPEVPPSFSCRRLLPKSRWLHCMQNAVFLPVLRSWYFFLAHRSLHFRSAKTRGLSPLTDKNCLLLQYSRQNRNSKRAKQRKRRFLPQILYVSGSGTVETAHRIFLKCAPLSLFFLRLALNCGNHPRWYKNSTHLPLVLNSRLKCCGCHINSGNALWHIR